MNKSPVAFLLLLFIIIPLGCATTYHERGSSGGYTGGWVDNRAIVVGFVGNAYSRTEPVREFAILRACELAIRRSFPRLGILSAESIRIYNTQMVSSATTYTEYQNGFINRTYSFPARFTSTSWPVGEVRALALFPSEMDQFRDGGTVFIDPYEYVREHASPELRDAILAQDGADIMMPTTP